MKKLLAVILGLGLFFTALTADAFVKKGKAGPVKIEISSVKPLVTGDNNLVIKLKKGAKSLDNAKVAIRVFMPEMPGMPYMETRDDAKFDKNGEYKATIDLMMSGTWQIRVFIHAADGKKYRYKSSLVF